MKKREQRELIPVTSYDQVPDGMTEDEAHEFWSTHAFTEEYIASSPPVSDDDFPPIEPLREYGPILLDREVFRKARFLARHRGLSIEDLIGEMVDQSIEARSYRKQRPAMRTSAETDVSRPVVHEPIRATGS